MHSLPFDKNVENPKDEGGGNVWGGGLEWVDFPIIGHTKQIFQICVGEL